MKKKPSKKHKNRPVEKYRLGILALRKLQQELGKPPKRSKVDGLVKELIKKVDLRGDKLETYFRLYATCALRNQEALCRYWKG